MIRVINLLNDISRNFKHLIYIYMLFLELKKVYIYLKMHIYIYIYIRVFFVDQNGKRKICI